MTGTGDAFTVPLSSCSIAAETDIRRSSPRPPELRNAQYEAQFDWDTLFYDVYRVEQHVVFQGPPLFNLLGHLRQSQLLAAALDDRRRARLVERKAGSEIWLRSEADRVELACSLGTFAIEVQPNLSSLFAGKRVLHTLSKDNDIRWIRDWIRFYSAVHGADAVLLYDNASTRYDAAGLREELRAAFPDMTIEVVHWPFKYGPQGGLAGAVDGREAPWDSDFCQSGSLQHARFRFLLRARSVLNVDIDELVLSSRGRSIFAATERNWLGFTKFPGRWITGIGSARAADSASLGDYVLFDRDEDEACPPKWCLVPSKRHRWKYDWSVHNLFGAWANRRISREFTYRHMRAISNNWKADRKHDSLPAERYAVDQELAAGLRGAGLREP